MQYGSLTTASVMVVFVDIDMYRLVVENQSFFFVCFFLTHMQLVINMDQTHT